MSRREAILQGTRAAQRLHARLGTRSALETRTISRVDVIRVAHTLGAVLLFKKLKSLLGAYLAGTAASPPGILVSTERDLHVQRFTAAHELGHFVMRHEPSLDDGVGLWRGGAHDVRELAADAFASEFLLPRWLYLHHAGRQGWHVSDLERPEIVYQLSLRLGASYEATCWGLRSHAILMPSAAHNLSKWEPRTLKANLLSGRAALSNPWADVWAINQADNGLALEGNPDDILIFRLAERSSAGYLWDESRIERLGFDVLADSRNESLEEECGGDVRRVLIVRAKEPGDYEIDLSERRPWDPDDVAGTLSVYCDMHGKEQGLPRVARKAMLAA